MPENVSTQNLIELEVTVENHTHKGELCKKGDKIKVPPETAKMLKAAWDKAKEDAK